MIKGIVIKEDKRNINRIIKYNGDIPTYKDVLDYCLKEIKNIKDSEDFKVLCYLYNKIKTKYNNQIKKLDNLNLTVDYLKSKKNLDNLWGE